MAPTGRIVYQPGYDEETAFVLLPSCNPGAIVDRPTRDQARAALRYLWIEMACDFPFRGVGEPAHRYDAGRYVDIDPERDLQWSKAMSVPDAFVGIAAVLTLLARPAILGAVPGSIFEAASQGSGKSLQMHAISMIATGRSASTATYPIKDGRPNEEELEKLLGAYALADASIIAFDNIRGTLGGAGIEQRLTAKKESSFRVLGQSERRTLPWHALILFSVNNAAMNDDMANRTLVSRVESPREDPRARPPESFRHRDLIEALEQRRDKLVRAALVILRAYVAAREAGETAEVEGGTMGSFEAWARMIPPALRWAGGPDILLARPEAGGGNDEEAEAHASLLRGWSSAWQGQRASHVVGVAFDAEDEARKASRHGMPHQPDGLDDFRAALRSLTRTPEGRRPSPHAFGIVLRRLTGKLRDGARLVRARDAHTKVALWSVERVKAGR
jgi:putative DNA primase/helicase